MLNQVKENDIILKEGDKDENLYKILNGKVVVYNGYGSDKETVIGILSAGSYFGELGVFAGEPSVYTVVAYDDALILSVDKEDLRTYLKQNDSDSYAIMSNMSKAMLMMKKNIDLLGQELTDLLKNREDSRRTEELKNRIKQSDVRKALLMYSNYSSLLP